MRAAKRSLNVAAALWLTLPWLAPVSILPAQTVRLGKPTAALDEEFADIRGVRELADGRVLVSDYLDQRVVVIDFDRKTILKRLGSGGGPLEARLPTRLVPGPGDSTLLVDLGNNRIQVLDGQGRPVRTIPAERPGMLGVRGVGPDGALYFAIPGWAEQGRELPNDSVRVVRLDPRTRAATQVAVIQGDRMRSDIRSPSRTPRIPVVGYAVQDAWVLDGGIVRVVRGGAYRVELVGPDGRHRAGPSYAYQTRPVSGADRSAFVRRFLTRSPAGGRGPNGGMGFAPPPTDQEIARTLPGTEFAKRHPMFDAGEVLVAPGGRLWVGLPAEVGRPTVYEVFDHAGQRVGRVEAPAGRRVLLVGEHGVYVVHESEEGLQHLERYRVP